MPATHTGRELAERGAERAAAHADATSSARPALWSDLAYDAFVKVARRGQPFMTEDVRQEAERGGLPPPPDGRAWGSIVQRATRANLVRRIGFAPMKSPNCHANPKSVWQLTTA